MNGMFGRREFLGTAAAAGLLVGCKVSKGAGDKGVTGNLAQQLQAIADQMLAEYPQNATILGIAKNALAPLAHQWQDQTPAGVATRKENISKRLATLRTDVDESFLDPAAVPRPGVAYPDDADATWRSTEKLEIGGKIRALLKKP